MWSTTRILQSREFLRNGIAKPRWRRSHRRTWIWCRIWRGGATTARHAAARYASRNPCGHLAKHCLWNSATKQLATWQPTSSAAAKPIPESNEQSIPSAATLHPTRPTNAARYANQFATKRYSTATTRTNYSKWCRSKHKRRIAAGQATWWYHGYQQSNSITDRCNGKPIG